MVTVTLEFDATSGCIALTFAATFVAGGSEHLNGRSQFPA
jgi:hypothetical protein